MRVFAPPRRRRIGPLNAVEFPASEGSPTVVCLHGYGADAEDLAPLASQLDLPRPVRWVLPDAPLPLDPFGRSQGRAWFPIEESDAERLQSGEALDLSAARPPGLEEAACALQEFLSALGQPTEQLAIGGFSQGAVLALESALRSDRTPLGLFILSGALLDEDSVTRRAPAHRGLKFFQSHGTDDPLLSCPQARRLHDVLNAAGWAGKFLEFRGAHCVPPEAARGLEDYLGSVLRAFDSHPPI